MCVRGGATCVLVHVWAGAFSRREGGGSFYEVRNSNPPPQKTCGCLRALALDCQSAILPPAMCFFIGGGGGGVWYSAMGPRPPQGLYR